MMTLVVVMICLYCSSLSVFFVIISIRRDWPTKLFVRSIGCNPFHFCFVRFAASFKQGGDGDGRWEMGDGRWEMGGSDLFDITFCSEERVHNIIQNISCVSTETGSPWRLYPLSSREAADVSSYVAVLT
jgi:hypothetical protein